MATAIPLALAKSTTGNGFQLVPQSNFTQAGGLSGFTQGTAQDVYNAINNRKSDLAGWISKGYTNYTNELNTLNSFGDLSSLDPTKLAQAYGSFNNGDWSQLAAVLSGQSVASGFVGGADAAGGFQSATQYAQDQQTNADVAAGKLIPIKNAQGQVTGYTVPGSPGDLLAQGKDPSSSTLPQFQGIIQQNNQMGIQQNPKITVPSTIPASVLGTNATTSGVLNQATGGQTMPSTPQGVIAKLVETLTPGSSSNEVKRLQQLIIDTGNKNDPAIAALAHAGSTGFYGPLTQAAVKAWQAGQGNTQVQGQNAPTGQNGASGGVIKDQSGVQADTTNFDFTKVDPTDQKSLVSAQFALTTKLADIQSQIAAKTAEMQKQMNIVQDKTIGMSYIGGQQTALRNFFNLQLAPLQQQEALIKTQMDGVKSLLDEANTASKAASDKTYQEAQIKNIESQIADRKANPSGGLTALQSQSQAEIATNNKLLLASRNQGAEADGVYADPNLYAKLRGQSVMSASEFDNRFGYLVNPASRAKLGITNANAGTDAVPGALTQGDMAKGLNWVLNNGTAADQEKFNTDRGFQAWVMSQVQ